MEYEIKLNKEHIHILIAALDLYSRIGIGQLEEAFHLTADYLSKESSWDVITTTEYQILKQKLLGMPYNASHGITSDKVHQVFKEAWTMQKILQKTIADAGNHQSHSVWHDGNILQLNQLPEIEVTDGK